MLPIVHLGPLAIQAPGLILLLGFWLGIELAERFCRRLGIAPARVQTLVLTGLGLAAVGGRMIYAARNFSAFAASPASLIALDVNLLDIPGGILLGLAGSLVVAWRYKMDGWALLDGLTPAFAVMLVATHLANLASGNAFGAPAQLPWSILLWGEWRHPSQIYETLGAITVLAWVLRRFSRLDQNVPKQCISGRFFLEFLAGSALWRIALETFRGDSILLLGQYRAAQIIAWVILAICLYLLGARSVPSTRENASTPPA